MASIVLASASPRRRELLGLAGVEFVVRPGSAPEVPLAGEAPAAFARRMSAEKARAAAGEGELVLGADTIVVLDEAEGSAIIGKPGDAEEARRLLRRLRGREHRVLTGLTVLDTGRGAAHGDLVESRVPMRAYGDDEVEAYVATGDPLDKAGGYAIQHAGFQPVDLARFEGCAANVMGLPVCAALRLLARAGAALEGPRGDCHAFDSVRCPVVERLFGNGLVKDEG